MDMHDLHKHHLHKEHQMRYGHLSKEDRENHHMNPRYGFLDQEDKQYHSPERPEPMEGEY